MTNAPLVIEVEKRDLTPIPIKFSDDKHVFQFSGAKVYGIMAPLMTDEVTEMEEVKALRDWLFKGLSKSDAARLEKRLLDPKDSLDVNELGEMAMKLMEHIGERPTT